jgi:hypothetical protein
MGRAIAFLSFVVLCSFAFVFWQLWVKRPARPVGPAMAAPALDMMDDGSVYAVRLRLDRFERRLMEEEERSGKLQQALDELGTQRTELEGRITALQAEVRRLRRQAAERQTPPTPAPETPTVPSGPEAPSEPPVIPGPE